MIRDLRTLEELFKSVFDTLLNFEFLLDELKKSNRWKQWAEGMSWHEFIWELRAESEVADHAHVAEGLITYMGWLIDKLTDGKGLPREDL